MHEMASYSPSPQPSPLSACGHTQAGIKGEGAFMTFFETVNLSYIESFGIVKKIVNGIDSYGKQNLS